jgi:hypothetical protein
MVFYHIDTVILDIDMGYGLMIWEMTVSIWSSSISIWDILSLCLHAVQESSRAGARRLAARGFSDGFTVARRDHRGVTAQVEIEGKV